MSEPKPILIGLKNAAGDSVVLSGAIRDLALQYPDRFRISMATNAHSVWYNNPHVQPPIETCEFIPLKYGDEMTRGNSDRSHTHFLKGMHNVLGAALGVHIEPTLPRPDLHVLPSEKPPKVQGPYWVIFAGHKRDLPLKAWPSSYWQQLVDQLAGWGIKCVQVGAENMPNPDLAGTQRLIGDTNLRELFALIRDAEGVICGITSGMHIAAALERPCVVLSGGRESWWWEAYVNENNGFGAASGKIKVPHRYLHTFGMLPCCQQVGCHKMSIYPGYKHPIDKICTQQVELRGNREAACMTAITPGKVIDAVLSYYLDGTLPPHSEPLKEMVSAVPDLRSIAEPLTILRADGTTLQISTAPSPTSAQHVDNVVMPEPLPRRAAFQPDPDFDNEKIGGRLTVCVMMYGDFPTMHKRCLDAILKSTSAERVEIRIGGNALCDHTTKYLEQLKKSGDIEILNLSPENRGKYPVMRELFHSPPLNTKWVIWFDDDTYCDTDPNWLKKLANQITATADPQVASHGPLYYYPLTPLWRQWCATAKWFKGRHWTPHGTRLMVNFMSGSFWALTKEAIENCDIPDLRLGHNKGDVTIGCQLHQSGYKISRFSQHKEIVNWSAEDRRGKTERHPAE